MNPQNNPTRKKSTENPATELTTLVAPCGMFCGICGSFLALKYKVPKRPHIVSHCAGCRPRNKQCAFLKKKCSPLLEHQLANCSECGDFPCGNLQKIDKNYMSKYHTPYSLIKTLEVAQKTSLQTALDAQLENFRCKRCGEYLCIHNKLCYHCDQEILATMGNYYNTK